jgi:copper transport protein
LSKNLSPSKSATTEIHHSLFIIWLAFSALVFLLAQALPVLAHASLLTADPEPNALLETPPPQVRILFSEPVTLGFSRILVFSQSGQQVDNADLKIDNADKTALAVTLPPLGNGTYLVSWQVISAVDGHTTSGSFPFGVGVSQLASAPGAPATTGPQPTLISIAARWLNLMGLALLLGVFVFRLWIWNPAFKSVELDEEDERLDLDFGRASLKVGVAGVALLAVALVLTLIAQASQAGRNPFTLEFYQIWLSTRFGWMWMVRLWLTVAAAFIVADLFAGLKLGRKGLRGWEWWAGLGFSIVILMTTSLVSHSAALRIEAADEPIVNLLHALALHQLAAVPPALNVDMLHLFAAGVWVGGLTQFALALWLARRLADESRAWLNLTLALNFSVLAAASVGVLILSGSYLASKHVGSWTALFGTAYGLALLAKLALILPTLGIAALNLLILKPKLNAAFDQPETESALKVQRRFGRLVCLEAVGALLILAATGVLTDFQRGQDAPLLAGQAEKVVLTQTADDLNVTVTLEPGLVGQNTFDVYLTQNNKPVTNASEVSLRFTFLGQSIGTAKADAGSLGDGHYRVDGGYLSLVGSWQVEVAVRRPDQFDTFAAFRVDAGLNGIIRPLEEQPGLLERLARFLTRGDGAVNGVLLILFAVGWSFFANRAAKWEWQLIPLLLPGLIAFLVGGVQLFTFFREFTPAKFLTNPVLPDSASIARGQELYQANCLACHGSEGRGDGPTSLGLNPRPADFTSGHTDSHPDGDVYYWIKTGVPNSAMPAFEEKFNDEDIWNLVNYVRRLSAQGRDAPATPTPIAPL